jgi:hypothetical protein
MDVLYINVVIGEVIKHAAYIIWPAGATRIAGAIPATGT